MWPGGGGVEGRSPQITFHNISVALWEMMMRHGRCGYLQQVQAGALVQPAVPCALFSQFMWHQ